MFKPRKTKLDPATPYVFDVKLQTSGNTHTVEIDTKSHYGWFENNTSGSGGGLWFEPAHNDKRNLELVDYDGVMCLPMKIIISLRDAGFEVSEEME